MSDSGADLEKGVPRVAPDRGGQGELPGVLPEGRLISAQQPGGGMGPPKCTERPSPQNVSGAPKWGVGPLSAQVPSSNETFSQDQG